MAADGLKQRLVGGATLLLVAVIAWFWLLSADSPVDPVARESQIPAEPDIRPFEVREPSQPQGIEPPGSARESTPVAQADAVPQPQALKQTQAQTVERPQAVVSPAPAPKPAQAAPQKTPPSAAQQAQLAEANATRSAVAKSNAAATGALAAASAQKTAPLKSTAPATKNNEPQAARPVVESKPKAGESKQASETFQLDQHGLPVAWVVQVGLFSTQASADKIKSTLQAKGYKAYTEPFKGEKASGIKVFVGPKLSRERADAQKKAIDELLKANTMVVRFVAN